MNASSLRLLLIASVLSIGCGKSRAPADVGDARFEGGGDVPRTDSGGTVQDGPRDAAAEADVSAPGPDGGDGGGVTSATAIWRTRDLGVVDGGTGAGDSGARVGDADSGAGAGVVLGSFAPANPGFIVRGGGSGVSGTRDGFFFTYQLFDGDADLQAEIGTLLKAPAGAQVGLMVRAGDADEGAANVFLNVIGTGTSGGQLQARLTAGGATAVTVTDPEVKLGQLLRLTRTSKVVTAYRSDGSGSWITVGIVEVDLPTTIAIGLAVSSEDPTLSASASVNLLRADNLGGNANTKDWSLAELGTTGGVAAVSSGAQVISLASVGAVSAETSDVGTLLLQAGSGLRTLTARVLSLSGGGPDASVGLTVRAGDLSALSPSALQGSLMLSRTGKAAFWNRRDAGGRLLAGAGVTGVTPPVWLRLEKLDDVNAGNSHFTASFSSDGATWNVVDSLTFSVGDPFSIGFSLTSGSVMDFVSATLGNISITRAK